MSAVKTGILYWLQIFLVPVYLLSCLIPRDKKLWVYGSSFGKRFADNPKYFYLYMNRYHAERIRSVWVTKDRKLYRELSRSGMPVYYLYTLQGIRTCLTAGVYVYDNYTKDISFCLSGRAKKVNLWHGIPLKKINMDNRYDKVRHPECLKDRIRWALRRMSDEKRSHYVLAVSDFMRPYFASAFRTKRVLVCGYPRNDSFDKTIGGLDRMLPDERKALRELAERKAEGGKKLFVYMPTFRGSEKRLFELVDWDRLLSFLQENNSLLAVKLHPKSAQRELWEKAEADQIAVLDANYDPYPYLQMADALITDYSSIYFDFLLLDRPIIFWDFDREEYLQESREFYFPYEAFTPGRKVRTQGELEEAVRRAVSDPSEYDRERALLREKIFRKEKHCGSELLYRKIYYGMLGNVRRQERFRPQE